MLRERAWAPLKDGLHVTLFGGLDRSQPLKLMAFPPRAPIVHTAVRIGNKPYHCNKGILEQSRANGLKFMSVETWMLNFFSHLV